MWRCCRTCLHAEEESSSKAAVSAPSAVRGNRIIQVGNPLSRVVKEDLLRVSPFALEAAPTIDAELMLVAVCRGPVSAGARLTTMSGVAMCAGRARR